MLESAFNTLLVATTVTILSLFCALTLAMLAHRFDFGVRQSFIKAWQIYFSIPSYILAMAWITAANPTVGWLQNDFGIPFFPIYGFWGIVFVESCFFSSFLFLSILAHLKTLPASYEESSRISGASFGIYFKSILLPLLIPKIIIPLSIVFLGSCASYGVPALLGSPAKFHVLTTTLTRLIKSGDNSEYIKAIELAAFFGLFSIFFFFVTRFLTRSLFSHIKASDTLSKPQVPKRGSIGLSLTLNFVFFLALVISFLFPFLVLLVSSFQNTPGRLTHSVYSVNAWQRLFNETPGFWESVLNSVLVSGTTAIGLVLFFVFLGLLNIFRRSYMRASTDVSVTGFSLLTQALPGSVVALFGIFLIQTLGLYFLNDTLIFLGLVYFLKNLSLADSQVTQGFNSLGIQQIQSARVSGASFSLIASRIVFPQIKRFLLLGFIFVFLPSLSEVTMTSLISGPRSPTLGVFVFELQEYSDKASASVVGFCLISIFILSGIMFKGKINNESQHS